MNGPSRVVALALGVVAVSHPAAARGEDSLTRESVRAAVARGLAFLLDAQNADGSWGGPWGGITTWSGETWSSPESHRSWRVATTGLCCLAVLEVGEAPPARAAADRALDYLVANARVKRPNEWDTMNCWAHIYGLQAVAAACGHRWYAGSPRQAALRSAAGIFLEQLGRTQSLSGGWGYLEFTPPRTARPQWATSFTTAAGIIALVEAQKQGLTVDEAMLARAVKAVRHCRLPNGAYTYSIQPITHPRRIGSIDRLNGSLCRIQVCNAALRLAGDDVPHERLRAGLEDFFREHRFLDIARLRPIPHEAFYQNSGYFYLFGHYYAALVILELPAEQRQDAWPRLWREILKIQGPDGSFRDYDHHAYAKPYGTAYALLALGHSLRDQAGGVERPAASPDGR